MEQETERSVRFDRFVGKLASVIGHADRHMPLKSYCLGLLLPGERKSVEPMAALTDPLRVSAKHQSLLHFVGKAPWSDSALLRVVRQEVLPVMQQHGPIAAWVVDDSGMPKKGKHSVGVKNQYCGVLGKNANCQVAVSVSLANQEASLPAAYRLYLPEDWADDLERRRLVGVPDDVAFEKKWQIALRLLDSLLAEEPAVPRAPVLADAGYVSRGTQTDPAQGGQTDPAESRFGADGWLRDLRIGARRDPAFEGVGDAADRAQRKRA